MKINPLTGRRFKVGDEYLLHVGADGLSELVLPTAPESRKRAVVVRISAITAAGIDEEVIHFRIWVTETGKPDRPVNVPPRGRDWYLAEGSLETPPIWHRRRTWKLEAK